MSFTKVDEPFYLPSMQLFSYDQTVKENN